jgi:hypothetical protein
MPLSMDVHPADGVSAGDVAEAHQKDLEVQGQYGVDYRSYWVDEKAERVFCLVEAPDAETAHRVTAKRTGWSRRRSTRCKRARSRPDRGSPVRQNCPREVCNLVT